MKNIIIITLILLTYSCSEPTKKSMIVEGTIKGLNKGTLYLAKIKDTLLVKVDSIKIDGKDTFTLSDEIESPEIYFLSLSETDKVLQFFGEEGKINIQTSLETFNYQSSITGSKNQDLLVEYLKTNQKFNDLKLDLIKSKFDASKKENTERVAEIEKELSNLIKRKYRYTLNFAVKHADYEISPYLTLSEIYDLNPKLLDTIVNSLSNKVKKSTYGKKLIQYVKEAKQ